MSTFLIRSPLMKQFAILFVAVGLLAAAGREDAVV
jgi:hypothetical protein